MFTAVARNDNGSKTVIVGVTREDFAVLLNATPHGIGHDVRGLPGVQIMVLAGESDMAILEHLQHLIDDDTEIGGLCPPP